MKTKYNEILDICTDCGEIYCEYHYSISEESMCPKCRGKTISCYSEDFDLWEVTIKKNKDKIKFTKNNLKELGQI